MATYNGQVTGGGLNLRASNSTSAALLIQIPNNTQIVVSDYSADSAWYCTTYSGNSGFVMKQYVNVLGNAATRSCTVTGGGLNLRNYPSTSAPSPIQIPNNTPLTAQTHNDTWSSTSYNGYSGFVMSQYLTSGRSGSTWVTRWIAPGAGQTVNIRQDASTSNPPVAVWAHGTKVEVNAPNSTWSEVRLYGSTTVTGWVMTQFLTTTDPTGGSSGGTTYSGNRYLTSAEMHTNAQYILNYLRSRGWSKNAVCGMLGNMQVESTINPGIWEGLNSGATNKGYGLVQWTPSTKWSNWANSRGYAMDSMDGQLQRIIFEVTATGSDAQWFKTTAYPITFSQFTTSTNSAYNLACAFVRNYERPASLNEATRGNNATNWYNTLS